MEKPDIFAWQKTGHYHVGLTFAFAIIDYEIMLCYIVYIMSDGRKLDKNNKKLQRTQKPYYYPNKIIMFLIDYWSSVAGGIQTVNRELCLALASYCKEMLGEQIQILCICKDCTQREREDAKRDGMTLIKADIIESAPGGDDRILDMLFHSSLERTADVICVVGHAKFTGLAARNVRDANFQNAKVVTTYQMDADETEGFKNDLKAVSEPEFSKFLEEWHQRVTLEHRIASRADIVFAIGPRLERSIKSSMVGKDEPVPIIKSLLCGLHENVIVRKRYPERPTFLFIGRVEHPKLKGVDLFSKAAGKLVKRWSQEWREEYSEPMFIVRGFPSDGEKAKIIFEKIKEEAENVAARSVHIVPRLYTTEETDLVKDILRASALVMPSQVEGFGLVALEAISFGVPIVVAKDSGVAEIIEKYCGRDGYEPRFIVDTRVREDEAAKLLADALAFFVKKPESGRILGRYLRDKLLEHCSWSVAARSFIEALEDIPAPRLADLSCEEIEEVLKLLRKEASYVNDECQRICGRTLEEIFVERDFEEWEARAMGGINDEVAALVAELPKSNRKGKGKKWPDVIEGLGATVILGAPGSGKTFLLLHEVYERCISAAEGLEDGVLSLDEITFAVYFHASYLGKRLVATSGSVIETAVDLLCERHRPFPDNCRAWLAQKFKKGQIILVVDALDELQ